MSQIIKVSKTLVQIIELFKMNIILSSLYKIAAPLSQELARLALN
jgi:hypothetical protein